MIFATEWRDKCLSGVYQGSVLATFQVQITARLQLNATKFETAAISWRFQSSNRHEIAAQIEAKIANVNFKKLHFQCTRSCITETWNIVHQVLTKPNCTYRLEFCV